MKKLISIVLLVITICSCFTACNTQKASVKSKENVTLKWIMPGPGKQKDSEIVWAKFNEEIKKLPGLENVTVNFEIIPFSEYKQKFLLMQTSGEKIDIVQTYTLDFPTEARNETFLPLSDLIEKETPDLKSELPEFMWNYGKIDNEIYQVPNYQMLPSLFSLKVPKALADQYMDITAVENVLAKPGYNKEFFDILDNYLSKVKKAGKLDLGFNTAFVTLYTRRNYELIAGDYGIQIDDDKVQVKMLSTLPEYKHTFDTMRDWYKKGYIRKDILSAKATDDDGKLGGSSLWINNDFNGARQKISAKGVEEYALYLYDSPYVPMSNAAGGLCILNGCENSKEAIRIIELMNTKKGKDLYNLLISGIDGQHYKKVGEDKIETIGYVGDGTSSSDYGLWKWVLGNTFNAYQTQANPENYKDFVFGYLNEGEKTKYSKLIGFAPDLTKIESKIAQVKSVVREYNNPLGSGALDNYETVYNEYMNKIESSGNKEIIAELQKQVDAFLAK